MAKATAVSPRDKTKDRAFLVLDIAISAKIDPIRGTILLAGELKPVSFILQHSCRLTGGFTSQIFLAGPLYEGNFVFTVGGFNEQYSVPP
jgi:hypothetical protein